MPKRYNMTITFETTVMGEGSQEPIPFSNTTQEYYSLDDQGVSMIEAEGVSFLQRLRDKGDAVKNIKKVQILAQGQ